MSGALDDNEMCKSHESDLFSLFLFALDDDQSGSNQWFIFVPEESCLLSIQQINKQLALRSTSWSDVHGGYF